MLTIVWDVDDVLNDLLRVWLERAWRPAHPEGAPAFEELVENPPHQILGVSLREYLASLDAFRLSMADGDLLPQPEVLDWFRRHGRECRHIALTATPLRAAPKSAAWVIRYFGEWIRSFNFVPSGRDEDPVNVYDRTKADFLRWWTAADILVDDNATHVQGAEALGLRAVLIPRPWNQSRLTLSAALAALTAMIKTDHSRISP